MELNKIKFDYYDSNLIDFDKNNPRGESKEMITNDDSFDKLVESIKQFGILEPIIIRPSSKNKERYMLVDGERRLRAANTIDLQKIPALLISKDLDGKILAYHVHMLRKQWDKAAETKSIKRIIKEIEKNDPKLNESEIKKEIKKITQASNTRINDLYILINYEDKYIDLVNLNSLDISYLIQGQTSFINKIISKYPEILNEFSISKLRHIIAEKSYKKLIPGTRYWMDTFKDVFNFPHEKEKIKNLLIEFLEEDSCSAEITFNKFRKIAEAYNEKIKTLTLETNKTQEIKKPLETTNISKKEKSDITLQVEVNKTKNKVNTLDKPLLISSASLDYSTISLTKKEQTSINDIRPKFEKIGKTFSSEEKEYISEAIRCLEMQCFKASILMIWSTGISRIINYISQNLNDYNLCSKTMKDNSTSFYKYHSSTFQISSKNIDEVKNASKDIQLLCYLTFKKFINESQFKKLRANYDTRNDCAHPTSIELKVNETIAIFENIQDFILGNSMLR